MKSQSRNAMDETKQTAVSIKQKITGAFLLALTCREWFSCSPYALQRSIDLHKEIADEGDMIEVTAREGDRFKR